MRRGSTVRAQVERVASNDDRVVRRRQRDVLATEEPLEIRLAEADMQEAGSAETTARSVAVTMRTPGADFDLAAGFLFGEDLIRAPNDIVAIRYCVDHAVRGAQNYNVVNVICRPGIAIDIAAAHRNFYVSSSCGVCGKASIDAVIESSCRRIESDLRIAARVLFELPARLRSEQTVFERTGGLHAAARFATDGTLIAMREDVGRHNAMDKLVGAAVLRHELPFSEEIVVVSGRLSFELVQKAVRAGVPLLAGISAPSSLAVELAEDSNVTLVGFLRDGRFNIYSAPHRIRDDAPPKREGQEQG